MVRGIAVYSFGCTGIMKKVQLTEGGKDVRGLKRESADGGANKGDLNVGHVD